MSQGKPLKTRRLANITPKSGDEQLSLNYRSVSLTVVICKMLGKSNESVKRDMREVQRGAMKIYNFRLKKEKIQQTGSCYTTMLKEE